MAYVDEQDINKAIIAAMRADGTVTGLIGAGANIRFYFRTPRSVQTFPWVRMNGQEELPMTSTRKGPKLEFVTQIGRRFFIVSQQTSLDEAAAVQKAIIDVMDAAPTNLTLTGTPTCFYVSRRGSFLDFHDESGTSTAGVYYVLGISSV